MAQKHHRVRIDRKAIRIIEGGPERVMIRFGEEHKAEGMRQAPKRTGTLARSIDFEVKVRGNEIRGTTFTTCGYGAWPELGTGIFGKTKKPIRPKRAKALWWEGADHPVPEVAGQRAQPYIKPSFDTAKKRMRKLCNEILGEMEREAAVT